ncbi:MAG: hypothetical protein IPJ61_02935 [Tessaracoccus sp.]|uniref:hypothetical protein n=1 Tax=Tessaracoccus sp. TaxID=1971211 RepID=UPI001EB3A0FC|nr:hypothetical protein [Tessaracoccus sp.]MBK7820041.1 hypothetical protein [Tessaracoccus sp.]
MAASIRRWQALFAAVALGLSVFVVTDAVAETGPDELEKLAQEAAPAHADGDYGRSSSLEEEERLRAAALPEAVSPGFYLEGDEIVVRIYSDVEAPAVESRTVPSRFTRASLEALKTSVAGLAGAEGVYFGLWYDAERDLVQVSGNLSEDALPEEPLRLGELRLETTEGGGRLSRSSDTSPHWGGAKIVKSTGGGPCSTGFAVKNSAGTKFMLTAAHCGALNTVWKSGSYTVGKIVKRAPYPTFDLALIGEKSYGTYIYMGGSTGSGTATGAAANPALYTKYCTSGSSSYENCDMDTLSLTGVLCAPDGCTSGLAVLVGISPVRPGDSGGPLVLKGASKVYPRGIVIAGSGLTTYAERWGPIQSYFSVSSVTS